jgi:hypothetical protein
MKEVILSCSSEEVIKAKWDGVRFTLIRQDRYPLESRVIILNPNELSKLGEFIEECK